MANLQPVKLLSILCICTKERQVSLTRSSNLFPITITFLPRHTPRLYPQHTWYLLYFYANIFLKFSQLHPNQPPSHSNEEHFHIPDKKIVYPYTAERRDVLGNISPGSRRTNKRFPKGQGGCISIYVHVQCTVYTERPFSVSLIFLLATDGVKYEVCTPPARTGGSVCTFKVVPSADLHVADVEKLQISPYLSWMLWQI